MAPDRNNRVKKINKNGNKTHSKCFEDSDWHVQAAQQEQIYRYYSLAGLATTLSGNKHFQKSIELQDPSTFGTYLLIQYFFCVFSM